MSLFVLFFLFGTSLATCKYKFIHNASELIEFSNDANGGTTYEGYTVFLVADINFNEEQSKQFTPITSFIGIFDGQGHVISDLVISSSSFQYESLFGYSAGTTIKNVVIDKSCSFSSAYSGSDYIQVAGIIAWCGVKLGSCVVENSVNMASVSYSGSSNLYLYIGGIAGFFDIPYNSDNNYQGKITNCVNYGNIYNSGSCVSAGHIGGMVGEVYAEMESVVHIYNCFNYGIITNVGTVSNFYYYMGGIAGQSYGCTIINCVSTGAISSSTGGVIGGIIGYSRNFVATLTHSYWTTSTGCTNYYGVDDSNYVISELSYISLDPTYSNVLNTYALSYNWNGWAYNQNSAKITFVVRNGSDDSFSYSSQLILFPEPVRRGYSFLFWCVNEDSLDGCNIKLNLVATTNFASATTLYAQWIPNICTVTLDVNGGDDLTVDKKVITTEYDRKYGESLVTPTKRGYTFIGWFTVTDELVTNESLVNSACNCSLRAEWVLSKYNVFLDVNGGDELVNDKIIVTFSSTYGELPIPKRSGFTFGGWFDGLNEEIISDTIVDITSDQTLYAQWIPVKYAVACKKELFIHNASELIEFSNSVNNGTTYSEYTVYLVNDIKYNEKYSRQYVPIGVDEQKTFRGTFDGQGYVVRNLTISTSSLHSVGLFRYSDGGTTVKNVVLDDLCSFTNSYTSGTNTLVAGTFSYCISNKGHCIIENCVNMANTTYTGSSNSIYSYVGGIIGCISIPNDNYYGKITNCVNYGTAADFGRSKGSRVGGITGHVAVSATNNVGHIYNCLNYGTVLSDGTSESYYIGGITGLDYGTIDTNCVSIGKVSSVNGNSVGGIIGYTKQHTTTFTHCFWTSDTECTNYVGEGISNIKGSAEYILINSTSAGEVSTYASNNGWSEWVYNKNSASIKFIVFDAEGFTYSSRLILLPEPVRRGYSFLFWCVNEDSLNDCDTKYIHSAATGFTEETTFYAQWIPNNCTIALDVNGGDALPDNEKEITVTTDIAYESLPMPTRRGYTFIGWFTVTDELVTNESLVNSACNCSLHAEWIIGKYSVILDVNGGNELVNDKIIVTFSSTYGELPIPKRSGFTFGGWFDGLNEEITSDTIVDITSDQTLYAQWIPVKYAVACKKKNFSFTMQVSSLSFRTV